MGFPPIGIMTLEAAVEGSQGNCAQVQ